MTPAADRLRLALRFAPALAALVVAGASIARAQGTTAWTYTAPYEVYSSIAQTADGYFVLGTSGDLPGNTGNRLVSFRRGLVANQVRWSVLLPDWVDSSPAIGSDGTIYVGCLNGRVYAINPTNGSTIATYPPMTTTTTLGFIVASPAIATDGTVYVGSADGTFVALNPNLTLKWTYAAGAELESSPAVLGDGSIVFGTTDGRIESLRPDGTLRWSVQVATVEGLGNAIRSSPAIGADGSVYVGSNNGRLYALDFAGRTKWILDTGAAIESSPVIGLDGMVIVGNQAGLLAAVDPDDGVELWTQTMTVPLVNTPAAVTTSTPTVDAFGNVYVLTDNSNNSSLLRCYSSSGSQRFLYPVPSFADSSPTIATVNGDNVVIFGAYNRVVYAVRAYGGPATTAWPKFRRDARSNARADSGPAPTFAEAPRGLVLAAGTYGSLSALPAGDEPFRLTWRRGGVAIAGSDANLLPIGPASASSAGLYDVVVENPFGTVTSPKVPVVVAEPLLAEGAGLRARWHVPAGTGAPAVSVATGSAPAGLSAATPTFETPAADGLSRPVSVLLPADGRGFATVTVGP